MDLAISKNKPEIPDFVEITAGANSLRSDMTVTLATANTQLAAAVA